MKKDDVIKEVQTKLWDMQDTGYREFQAKLIPTVDPKRIIGIRTPRLRAFAKQFGKTEAAGEFLKSLPHEYYEENNLHGLLIEQIHDYEKGLEELQRFLPCIDNWATCDMLTFSVAQKYPDIFIKEIYRWLDSEAPYTVRFGLSMLMKHYLDDRFEKEYAEKAAGICSDEYYVNMMRAWYFATALAKQYDKIIPFLEEKRLDTWTHNKTIQKAVESYRISPEQKKYLRTLKIKKQSK